MRLFTFMYLLLFSMSAGAIEQSQLVNMSDLAAIDISYSPDNESFETKKRLFFSELANYKYEDDELLLISTLQKNRSVSGKFAVTRFSIERVYEDFEFELENSTFTYGTKSELYSVIYNEVIVGSFFISQVEKYIFAFLIVGLTADDGFLEEVVRPKLVALTENN